jgi:hypothetical protein
VIEEIDSAINQLCRAARVRALYPVGHPSHANSLALAREALNSLFEATEHLQLTVTNEGLSCGEEALADPDGALAQVASVLRDQDICALTLRCGLDEDEIRVLLTVFGASADASEMDLAARVDGLGSDCLSVARLDYERLVPRNGAIEDAEGIPNGAELLRLLASSARPGDVPSASNGDVAVMIDDPQSLAAAMLSCITNAMPGIAEHPGEGTGAGIGDGEGDGIGTGGDLPLVIAGHPIERPNRAAALLALSIQRLAEVGCRARPDGRTEVFGNLAMALRQLDPQLLAHVFRADVVAQDAPFDALQEAANHLSLDDLLDVVRAHPQAVASEPSAVYRRLLRRIAPTGERLLQLAPALRTGLLADGMSEDVFTNTLGQALEAAAAEPESTGEGPLRGAAVPGVAGTSEALRAARREQIADLRQQESQADDPTSRAQLCMDLLQLQGHCGRHPHLLSTLRDCLRHVSPAERQAIAARVVEVLTPLTGRSDALPADLREVALSLLAEASDRDTLEGLRRSLFAVHDDEAPRIARALAMSGEAGRETLLDILLCAGPAEAARVPAIVAALTGVEAEETVADTGLSRIALDPRCRQTQTVIAALAEQGGPVASRHLILLLREGDFGIRSEVVRSARQPGRSLLDVLAVALDDPDDDIRCAAAASLGASGDERAARPLLHHLRPFAPWDPNFRLRAATARALGQLGCAEAEPRLVQVLQRTSWVRRSQCDELRAAAAEALLRIGTSGALRAVADRGAKERSPAIKQHAAVALGRLRERRGGLERPEEEAVHAD